MATPQGAASGQQVGRQLEMLPDPAARRSALACNTLTRRRGSGRASVHAGDRTGQKDCLKVGEGPMTSGFRGVYPMLYAFFDRAGGLDREAMRRQVEFSVGNGAHGIAVLGLATEVGKLTPDERLTLVRWATEDLRGRLPLAVTVSGASVDEQAGFVEAVADRGADWVILQPPTGAPLGEDELIGFFGQVADRAAIPVGIQNAPQYIGSGLSLAGIDRLRRAHPNLRLVKAEGSAVETERLVEATEGQLTIFQGRGGLEFTDVMRAGSAGMIPSVESCRLLAAIFELMASGDPEDEADAERLYTTLAPLLVFLMQSVPSLICYGKRLTAARIGIPEVVDREPALKPTPFGLTCVARHARVLDLPW
jgi:4-hydroxy-tetrahydrodipicolinate synthase